MKFWKRHAWKIASPLTVYELKSKVNETKVKFSQTQRDIGD